MKVYVLIWWSYEFSQVLGVYSTNIKAERAAAHAPDTIDGQSMIGINVKPFTVDRTHSYWLELEDHS